MWSRWALLAAGALCLAPSLAFGQIYVGNSHPAPEIEAAIASALERELHLPAGFEISIDKKSLARNGHGYCGSVSPGKGQPFQPFHVIVDPDGKTSLLMLPDERKQGDMLSAEDTKKMLTNFGCME
ncbi:hypothetical protein OSH11_20225 [Kaistia dalseonensis]|uniref:Uncharacterized protein n=1 Tax=Kaistia dalseonensis TaxID=410840 RepID=A0ABU0HBI6_9HYPH|nr:hypothetical protein [Kaistia dalseonensis]MCX5497043.1 hypothetical protein [Kaistia dalseonensis]MDQ0439669.1 hypothetical protein [Kaistia dalseonensis]